MLYTSYHTIQFTNSEVYLNLPIQFASLLIADNMTMLNMPILPLILTNGTFSGILWSMDSSTSDIALVPRFPLFPCDMMHTVNNDNTLAFWVRWLWRRSSKSSLQTSTLLWLTTKILLPADWAPFFVPHRLHLCSHECCRESWLPVLLCPVAMEGCSFHSNGRVFQSLQYQGNMWGC